MQQKLTKKFLVDMARGLGVKNAAKYRKAELIHEIQKAEGHNPCFQRIPNCGIQDCLFRSECIPS